MRKTMARCCGWALAAAAAAAQSPTAVVQGQVLGPLGAPVGGAEVWAADGSRTGPRLATVRTDGDGRFALAGLPRRADAWILAAADGLSTAGVHLGGEAAPRCALALRLWDAMVVRGRVIDAGGVPIAGASVLATRDHAGCFVPSEATTDAQGNYELRGVPVGDYVLRAWAPGHLLRQFWYDGAADHERTLPLHCGDGGVIAVQVLDLPPSALASTAARLAIANDALELPTALAQGACDAQGFCAFTGLVDFDWEVTLASRDYSFVPRVRQAKLAALPANPWFNAQRRGTLLLRGVLRRTDGPALAGVRVSRDTHGETFAADESAVTDRGGAFCIATSLLAGEPFVLRLADREWVLKQDKRPQQRGYLERAYASCYEGVADSKGELRLEAERGAVVRARIVDADGVPVALERAELQDDMTPRGWYEIAEGASEPDGTVAFPTISPIADELRVRVACPRGFAVSPPFRLAFRGQRVLELRLQRPGAIEGTVSGPDGAPLPGVCVVLQDVLKDRNQTLVTPVHKVLADRRGRFRFVAVPPGPHQLALVAPNGSRVMLADVDVAPGAAVTQHCLAR